MKAALSMALRRELSGGMLGAVVLACRSRERGGRLQAQLLAEAAAAGVQDPQIEVTKPALLILRPRPPVRLSSISAGLVNSEAVPRQILDESSKPAWCEAESTDSLVTQAASAGWQEALRFETWLK